MRKQIASLCLLSLVSLLASGLLLSQRPRRPPLEATCNRWLDQIFGYRHTRVRVDAKPEGGWRVVAVSPLEGPLQQQFLLSVRTLLVLDERRGDELLAVHSRPPFLDEERKSWGAAGLLCLLALASCLRAGRLLRQRPRRLACAAKGKVNRDASCPLPPMVQAGLIMETFSRAQADEIYRRLKPEDADRLRQAVATLPDTSLQQRQQALQSYHKRRGQACSGTCKNGCRCEDNAALTLRYYLMAPTPTEAAPLLPVGRRPNRRRPGLILLVGLALVGGCKLLLPESDLDLSALRQSTGLDVLAQRGEREGRGGTVVVFPGLQQAEAERLWPTVRGQYPDGNLALLGLSISSSPLPVLVGLGGLALAAWLAYRPRRRIRPVPRLETLRLPVARPAAPAPKTAPAPFGLLVLEIGRGLLPLIDPSRKIPLLAGIGDLRRSFQKDLGFALPGVRVQNPTLKPNEFRLLVEEVEVGRGEVRMGHVLVFGEESQLAAAPGQIDHDPTFGKTCKWVLAANQEHFADLPRLDPVGVIVTLLSEKARAHASDLLQREDVQTLLDEAARDQPTLVQEVRQRVPLGVLHYVLWALLDEQVSIRNLPRILTTVCDQIGGRVNPVLLTEMVRAQLARQICAALPPEIQVIRLEDELESLLAAGVRHNRHDMRVDLEQDTIVRFQEAYGAVRQMLLDQGLRPVTVVGATVRPLLRELLRHSYPNDVILSFHEIPGGRSLKEIGRVGLGPRLEGGA